MRAISAFSTGRTDVLSARPLVTIAVEGDLDEEVLRRLVDHVGGEVADVHGKEGDDFIRERLQGYNAAAQQMPWCVLVDLNHKAACPPELRRRWLESDPSPQFCFRIAVRAVEAWLLADPSGLGDHLSVSGDNIPPQPESVDRPKQRMVAIARGSQDRAIREDMVPREGSGRGVGRAYTSHLVEFAKDRWRPGVAAANADSLARAIERLDALNAD